MPPAHNSRGGLSAKEGAGDVEVKDAAKSVGRVVKRVGAVAEACAGEKPADRVGRSGDGGYGGEAICNFCDIGNVESVLGDDIVVVMSNGGQVT